MELEKGSVGRNNHIRLHLVLGFHLQMLCVDQKAFWILLWSWNKLSISQAIHSFVTCLRGTWV